jgi:hypothetical protein
MLAIPITYAYTKEALKKVNPEKLATYGPQYEAKQSKNTAQYVWTPLCVNKYK